MHKNERDPLAQKPEAWRMYAIGLRRSAELIWEQWHSLFSKLGVKPTSFTSQEADDLILLLPSFLLLSGLSLENLLKGVLIAIEPPRQEGRLDWEIPRGGHDLPTLCERAGIAISTDELRMLNALTEAVLWAGRYPVPIRHDNRREWPIPLGMELAGMTPDNLAEHFTNYKHSFDSLFSRICELYPQQGCYER